MRRLAWLLAAGLAAGCAAAPPPVIAPVAPQYPDFVYPAPPVTTPKAVADRMARGWRLLQGNDLGAAEREFAAILKASAGFAPAATGAGYVELARQRPDAALPRFEAALPAGRHYAPALVGRGLALLGTGRDEDALVSFEAAHAADPALPDLTGRIETLRVRVAQNRVGRAERAAAAERWDEARVAYRTAIDASPESAFLHRDLAFMERKAGHADEALAQARAAIALDPDDPRSHVLVAEILAERDDLEGALAAYRRAADIDASPAVEGAIGRLRERLRDAALPPQYRAIRDLPQVTRADIAALLAVRLAPVLTGAPQRQLVVTDVRGHWATPWIETVIRAGAMEVFANYTFQPGAPIRRGDLADAVSRVLALVAAANPALAARWESAPVTVADVPPAHLAYPAVERAVAAGVLPLRDGGFQLLAPVTGVEASDAVARLAALAAPAGGRR